MTIYTKIGAVSSATLDIADLMGAFCAELDEIAWKLKKGGDNEGAVRLSALTDEIVDKYENSGIDDYFESEEAQWDLEEVTDELNNFAPPFCYFGAHEGDGACFGFWISEESLQDAMHSGEIIQVSAGDEWPEDEVRERVEAGLDLFILEVNDHGNMTLYTPEKEEVWSVV